MVEYVDREFEGDAWKEVLILPFSRDMSQVRDDGWLQWDESELIVIPGWVYCLLGIAWPLLRLVYRRPLLGQKTDYCSIK